MIQDDDEDLEGGLHEWLPRIAEEQMIVGHPKPNRIIRADHVEEGSKQWKRVTILSGWEILNPLVWNKGVTFQEYFEKVTVKTKYCNR